VGQEGTKDKTTQVITAWYDQEVQGTSFYTMLRYIRQDIKGLANTNMWPSNNQGTTIGILPGMFFTSPDKVVTKENDQQCQYNKANMHTTEDVNTKTQDLSKSCLMPPNTWDELGVTTMSVPQCLDQTPQMIQVFGPILQSLRTRTAYTGDTLQ